MPSPAYPWAHSHKYDPSVLMHVAFSLQAWTTSKHSLSSVIRNHKQTQGKKSHRSALIIQPFLVIYIVNAQTHTTTVKQVAVCQQFLQDFYERYYSSSPFSDSINYLIQSFHLVVMFLHSILCCLCPYKWPAGEQCTIVDTHNWSEPKVVFIGKLCKANNSDQVSRDISSSYQTRPYLWYAMNSSNFAFMMSIFSLPNSRPLACILQIYQQNSPKQLCPLPVIPSPHWHR